jgi:molybdate transport system regulatory protein
MNIFKGKITSIKVSGSLSLVEVNVGDILFKSIVIETPGTAAWLVDDNEINVIFKETEVVIGKGSQHAVSMQNKIPGKIFEIDNGALLSKITIVTPVGKVVAIITYNAVQQLQLQVGETITAMIKTNEIMLSQ